MLTDEVRFTSPLAEIISIVPEVIANVPVFVDDVPPVATILLSGKSEPTLLPYYETKYENIFERFP